jgi:hypothetical protein
MSARSGGGNPWESVFGWLPGWLGFLFILIAGGLAIVYGTAVTPSAGLIAFGIAAILSVIVAWHSGAVSKPTVNPFKKSFGGTVSNIDGWAWIIVFGLFVAATVVAFVAG